MTQTTRRTALRTTLGLAALALFALTGCGGGEGNVTPGIDPTVGQTRQFNNLEFNLTTTKRSFALDETVPLNFSIKNLSQNPVTITTLSGPERFEITRNGQVVGTGPGGTGGSYSLTLAAGERRQFAYDYFFASSTNVAGDYQVLVWIEALTVNNQSVSEETAKTTYNANPITLSVR